MSYGKLAEARRRIVARMRILIAVAKFYHVRRAMRTSLSLDCQAFRVSESSLMVIGEVFKRYENCDKQEVERADE